MLLAVSFFYLFHLKFAFSQRKKKKIKTEDKIIKDDRKC